MGDYMKFIDLFAGVGGFRLAFESLGAECVFSSEIDKFACETYKANFGEIPHGDITKIDAKDIPNFDILCAGFPCQPFSQAGKRKGFDDERGTLFDEIIRIVEYHEPKAILLENVKGLVNHDGGRTLILIVSKLLDAGYNVKYECLRACDYGLPTLRPRIYFVCFKDSLNLKNFQWPEKIPLKFTMSDVLKEPCLRDIGLTIRKGGFRSGINDRHNFDSYRMKDNSVRRLNLYGMKMMMGFPDDFKFPVSKTQAMKQIGNSVAVDVIRLIGEQMMKAMK